jgi:uncharacterized protein Yka (UPF0111/DUF47 family)
LDQADLVHKASVLLSEEAVSPDNARSAFAGKINALEHDGDLLVRKSVVYFNRDFSLFVPYSPEIFHNLSSCLDDILDVIEEAAFRLSAYRCQKITEGIARLCEYVVSCAQAIYAGVKAVVQGTNAGHACSPILLLTKQANDLWRAVLRDLFSNTNDGLDLLKTKEFCDVLKEALELCEHAAKQLYLMEMRYA